MSVVEKVIVFTPVFMKGAHCIKSKSSEFSIYSEKVMIEKGYFE